MWQILYSNRLYFYHRASTYLNAIISFFVLHNQNEAQLTPSNSQSDSKECIEPTTNVITSENTVISTTQNYNKQTVGNIKKKNKKKKIVNFIPTKQSQLPPMQSTNIEMGEEVFFSWDTKKSKDHKTFSQKKMVDAPKLSIKKPIELLKITLINYPTDIFAHANENYIKLANIFNELKKSGSNSINNDIRNQVYYYCIDMLEELKQALEEILSKKNKKTIIDLIERVSILRNIFADRPDYLLSGVYPKKSFVSHHDSCLLKVVINTHSMVREYLSANYKKEININNKDLEKNKIYQEIYPDHLLLPIATPWKCLEIIHQLLENELPSLLPSNGKVLGQNDLDDFLKNEKLLLDARVFMIKLGSYIRALKDQCSDFCLKSINYNLDSWQGMLFVCLEGLAKKNDSKLLQIILESWSTERVLAVCVGLRNDAVHFQSICNKDKLSVEAKPKVLFFTLLALRKKSLEISEKIKQADLNAQVNQDTNKIYEAQHTTFFKHQLPSKEDSMEVPNTIVNLKM